jgi:hypothetical protein
MVSEETMTVPYRFILIVGALAILAIMLWRIRNSRIRISDSVFWFLFIFLLFLLALFPGITFYLADLIGIESPANLVFLIVVAVLLMREFKTTAEISQLRSKVATLAQEIALKNSTDSDTFERSDQ